MESAMDETARYLKKAWLTWERLRIAYNLVLLVEGLTCLFFLWQLGKCADHACPALLGGWTVVIPFGVAANVFYCLGPLAETYVCVLLGHRLGRARYSLFAAGLLFSMCVTLAPAMRLWGHISGYLR
jgi:hypothetical protein